MSDGRVIISSRAAWQSTDILTAGTSPGRQIMSFLVMQGKCSDATIDAVVFNVGNFRLSGGEKR